MLYLDLTLEDVQLTAKNPSVAHHDPWEIYVTDTVSGLEDQTNWSDQQLVAVVALSITSDEHPDIERLRPIAEQAMARLNPDLRLIP